MTDSNKQHSVHWFFRARSSYQLYSEIVAVKELETSVDSARKSLEPIQNVIFADRVYYLEFLSSVLHESYLQLSDIQDINEAVELMRQVLHLRSAESPGRIKSLSNLVRAILTLFKKSGTTQDLDEAIQLQRLVLELCIRGHPDHSQVLSQLASILTTRFEEVVLPRTWTRQLICTMRHFNSVLLGIRTVVYPSENLQMLCCRVSNKQVRCRTWKMRLSCVVKHSIFFLQAMRATVAPWFSSQTLCLCGSNKLAQCRI